MTNEKSIDIQELTSEQDWKKAYPIMKQLRTHLSEEEYLTLVQEATEKEN